MTRSNGLSRVLDRPTDSVLAHSLRFSASEEAVNGRSPLPSLGLRMVSGVFPAPTVSHLLAGTA
jgi:hypothetical protein